MYAVPLNSTEGIFERFWDPLRSRLDDWCFSAAPATGSAIQQAWHAVYINWKCGAGQVGRMERHLDLATEPYDHLMLCASLPESAHLTVTVTGEEGRQTVIERQTGANTYVEYEGSLQGLRHIRAIELELDDQSREPGLCILQWIGLFQRAQRDIIRNRPSPYPDDWRDLMLPAEESVEATPKLSLFFGADALPALRRKAQVPPYAELVEALRGIARAHAADEPWHGIGACPNPGARCGRGGQPLIDPLAMRLCAFIGLLDNDPVLLRMALQHALAAAHCDDWSADFRDTLPGHTFDQRAFFEYRIATNVIFAWDWAGACLTEPGVQVLAEAVAMKGLPRILHTFMRYPYVRGCNQGAYFAYGAILCEIALSKIWEHGGELLPPAVQALDETVQTYFAEDGGAFEGVGYVSATIGHALVAYQALARQRGVPLRDLVPPKLVRTANYLTTMLSTAPPFGGSINVADGGRPGSVLFPDGLAALCAVSADPAIPALLAGMLAPAAAERENYGTPGSLFNFIFGPDTLPRPEARPPVFRILPQTGMLCSCRSTDHGPVRLQLIGAPANAGHAHEDKGSFVIEAFGEEIAIERGQMGYDDSRCALIKFARYHNVLIPETPDEPLPSQVNPCPAAALPEGHGDERVLEARIDATGAWGQWVERWVRVIESHTPTEFLVSDEMTLPEVRGASFHLHSRFPWTRTPAGGWLTRGQRAALTVAPEWQPVAATGAADFIDGCKQPVFHLILKAAPARAHCLRTRLTLAPL